MIRLSVPFIDDNEMNEIKKCFKFRISGARE